MRFGRHSAPHHNRTPSATRWFTAVNQHHVIANEAPRLVLESAGTDLVVYRGKLGQFEAHVNGHALFVYRGKPRVTLRRISGA